MSDLSLRDSISEDFYKGGGREVYTVAEMISQLEKLPKDLAIEHGFSAGVRLVVYNISLNNPHLGIAEND